MKIKFKATIIILALVFLTSLILPKKENAIQVKLTQTKDTISQEVSKKTIKVLKTEKYKKIVDRSVNSQIRNIEMTSIGLNTELPLPELMQNSGFKIQFESVIDCAAAEHLCETI
jgi:hypothetical protein